jgi:hypothetical protein
MLNIQELLDGHPMDGAGMEAVQGGFNEQLHIV